MSRIEFKLPDIGEGVHEGEIVRWIKGVGDEVAEDEPVVEVMTDKATVEIPSPASGKILETRYQEGDVANVGDVLFVLETADQAAAGGAAAAAPAAEPVPAPEPAAPAAEPAAATATATTPPPSGGGGRLEFRLPDIGEGVHEGEIVRWIKEVGDEVAEDEPVVEVMTDKATVEIPSPASGKVVETRFQEGDVANVGDVLFVLETADGGGGAVAAAAAAPAAAPESSAPAAPAAPAAAPSQPAGPPPPADPGRKVLAAPATRMLARELGVDLTAVRGSGPNGRIRPEDVRAAAAAQAAPAAPAPAAPMPAPSAPPPAAPAAGAAPSAPPPSFPAVAGSREVERIPFRGIRRKTAEAMARSKRTAAHFTVVEEVDCANLVAARRKAKEVGLRHGVNVTYMPFIMKATAIALQELPQLNAELDEEKQEVLVKKYVNLGIAVDTPRGLVVPVVHDVHLKGLLQLAADLKDVAERARDGKLKPEDFRDGTFSITNAGNIGGTLATPVINFPEVAILGVHRMRELPRVVDGEVVVRPVMNLSCSIDHRLVDGADGARFLVRMRELLEDPTLMLL